MVLTGIAISVLAAGVGASALLARRRTVEHGESLAPAAATAPVRSASAAATAPAGQPSALLADPRVSAHAAADAEPKEMINWMDLVPPMNRDPEE